jgi:hypothetical protein
MLKSLFESARNALSSHASLLRQSLGALAHLEPKLATRAAAYVLDGSEATVLLDLRTRSPDAGVLLGRPGSAFWGYYHRGHDDKQVEAPSRPA